MSRRNFYTNAWRVNLNESKFLSPELFLPLPPVLELVRLRELPSPPSPESALGLNGRQDHRGGQVHLQVVMVLLLQVAPAAAAPGGDLPRGAPGAAGRRVNVQPGEMFLLISKTWQKTILAH